MPLNTERERCTAAFLASGNLFVARLFSDQFADLVHEKKRCGDEQSENDDPDRREGGHAGMVAWRGRMAEGCRDASRFLFAWFVCSTACAIRCAFVKI